MKKYIPKIILCFISIIVSSCEKEESNWKRPADISRFVPNECVLLSGSCGVANNTANFNYKISFVGDFEFWQLQVNSVEYFFDGVLVDHQDSSPYEVKYQATDLTKGTHSFTIRANILDMYSNINFSIEKNKEIDISSDGGNIDNPANSLYCSYSTSVSGDNVSFNISEVTLPYQLKNDNWEITAVSYYLDDKIIGNITEAPFAFTHFAKLSKGIHQLKIRANIVNSVSHNTDIVETIIETEVK